MSTNDVKSQVVASGRTVISAMRLPYCVHRYGVTRSFGSLAKARAFASSGSQIFFDYEPGSGYLIEKR